jgi:glutamate carboxypeptidase
VSDEELEALQATVEASLPRYLDDLEQLVNIDCGSYTKSGVDRAGGWMTERLTSLGARIERHPNGRLGDTIVGLLDGPADGPSVLLIGHLDTVFDPGTVAERPFRIEGGRAFGPGVSDMKCGLLAGPYALAALQACQPDLPFSRLAFVANPDEEIGSPSSGPIIRALAAEADASFVLESARANGDVVSARKGLLDLTIRFQGRAAHAGVEPHKGRSATLAAAHAAVALDTLNGRWPGVTVNVGVIAGGTRPNVVAEAARLELDLRATTRADLDAAEEAVRAIAAAPVVADVVTTVEVAARHWPMEKLPASQALVDHAVALAGRLGFSLGDAATGGASDANTTAGLGVPTLDGLGPIGGHDHAPGEYLELDSIVPRITLLAALLLTVGRDGQLLRQRRNVRPQVSQTT